MRVTGFGIRRGQRRPHVVDAALFSRANETKERVNTQFSRETPPLPSQKKLAHGCQSGAADFSPDQRHL